ncbi:hypothetical protein B0H34DRAFT_796520 [Crassisporium funariophilum]|nr:hypothetical protein B0H34DRAFT_796520 [Crassisporium funariophilum]
MHSSPFTVAGMSSSTSSHHSPNLNNWGSTSTGGPLATSFGDSLAQSRSHYQSGYLMSASQSNNAPQGNQRIDEVPVVQTKAKMNQILSRGSTSDFGMDSMFQSSRQRQTLADEDAPPTSSINDIPNEVNLDPSPGRFQSRKATSEVSQFTSSRRHVQAPSTSQNSQIYYVIVFGYPADKFSLTAEYFKSFGESTDPDPNTELLNCFRIGYKDAGDALRAVRKNGEVLSGSWMVGAKWQDPLQGETLLGQPILRNTFSSPGNGSLSSPSGNDMAVDEPYSPSGHQQSNVSTPIVGTPIRLVPSTSAFRKGPVGGASSKPATPQQKGWGASILPASSGTPSGTVMPSAVPATGVQTSPSKSVVGQVTDLIFGW